MPTFFARRYARKLDAVGNIEKTLGVLIILLLAAIVVAFGVQVATDRDYLFDVAETQADESAVAAPSGENPFPPSDLAGWSAPRRAEHFSPDRLFIKIDGQAEAYLKLHVAGLTFGSYYLESDANRTVDVYWYDMGTPAGAQSMYESEKAPDATVVAIGHAGYQAGGAVFFCKGSSYVQVLPAGTDDADGRAALKIAARVAERIENAAPK